MTYDLTKFDLGDILKCSLRLREAASGAASVEASARSSCSPPYVCRRPQPTDSGRSPSMWRAHSRGSTMRASSTRHFSLPLVLRER